MSGSDAYTCERCGIDIPRTANHTEIVRRDFVDVPRPARIERLCADCWRAYIEEFLSLDFEERLESYDRQRTLDSS